MANTEQDIRITMDVATVMAQVVMEKTPFDETTYKRSIVPSKRPMEGFEANLPYWSYVLGKIEARLEHVNRTYRVFNASENFAKRSLDAELNVTIIKISKLIAKRRRSLQEDLQAQLEDLKDEDWE